MLQNIMYYNNYNLYSTLYNILYFVNWTMETS